jgi:hypothetical protein
MPQPTSLVTPGWVTFAAIIMFLVGGFQLAWAVVEFANPALVAANRSVTFGGHVWIWGYIDIALAVMALYAAFDLLAGGRFGQVFGLVVAGLSALRWCFNLPSAPWVAVLVLAVDGLVIYGLVSQRDYFRAKRSLRASPGATGTQ